MSVPRIDPTCLAGAATGAPFPDSYLAAATVIDVPRDVIDVLTQLLAFLGRQLALRRWPISILATAVFHRGGAAAALFAAATARRTLSAPFFLSAGLHCVPTAEKAAESAKAAVITTITTGVRRRSGHAQGKYTGQQRQVLPKHE